MTTTKKVRREIRGLNGKIKAGATKKEMSIEESAKTKIPPKTLGESTERICLTTQTPIMHPSQQAQTHLPLNNCQCIHLNY